MEEHKLEDSERDLIDGQEYVLGKITPELDNIPPESIDPGKRFRKIYNGIPALAASLKREGMIHPIAVMRKPETPEPDWTPGLPFLLLAGGRRLTAALAARMETVPVRIYPPLKSLERREVELIENTQREALAYAEEVKIKAEIHELEIAKYGKNLGGSNRGGASTRTTAELLGESRSNLYRDLELNEAIEVFPDLAEKKSKSEAYRALQKRKEDMLQKQLAKRIEERSHNLDAVKQRLISSFIVGDFFEKVKEVPDASIHGIELDPPYAVDLEDISTAAGKEEIHDGYNEVPADEYIEFLDRTLTECRRVLRSDGWLLHWFASRWQESVKRNLEKHGFKFHAVPAQWVKPEPGNSRQPGVNLGIQYEPFFYARMPNARIMRQGRGNCFNFRRPLKRGHPAERPIELIQEILGTFLNPGANILVPFLGTGATILAAANIGMKAHGYELTSKFKDRFVVKVAESEPGSYTSYE